MKTWKTKIIKLAEKVEMLRNIKNDFILSHPNSIFIQLRDLNLELSKRGELEIILIRKTVSLPSLMRKKILLKKIDSLKR